jgi:hypothetical protein
MIAGNIDHTQYIVISVRGDISNDEKKKYKPIKINETKLLFIPCNELGNLVKDFQGKYEMITFSWSIMYPVLKTVLNEDWDFKFENDEDYDILEGIKEEYNEPEERLDKIEEFFKQKYQWPDGVPDPILHTRVIIIPKDSSTDFIFYYGETVELQNNSQNDVCYLFSLIWEERKNTRINSELSKQEV